MSEATRTSNADPATRATTNGGTKRAQKKRMLVIVNPYATTVSDRLKNLVVYALQGRYQVEAVSTQAQNHATEIGREAVDGGYDVVVAFGGDGTLNEVAHGLAGTDIPVTMLPGGRTNVVCRSLGVPGDVVDATEHLLGLADDFRPRKIDLGLASGRHFVFACGSGLDAMVVKRVDAHPKLKSRFGEWYYTYAAITGFNRHYLLETPARLRLRSEQGGVEGITAVAQNSEPFTYFGDREVRVCEGAAFDNGTLSLAMLKRAALRDIPTLMARCLTRSDRYRAVNHRQIDHFRGLREARVDSLSTDATGETVPFPVEVDGDYIGDHTSLELGIDPGALTIIA
ncbi:MAG: diacylglycerol kinase family protein [Solirubrobacterales bacterium]